MFAFKDPRLRHLNKGFKRSELMIDGLDFSTEDTEGFS